MSLTYLSVTHCRSLQRSHYTRGNWDIYLLGFLARNLLCVERCYSW